MKPSSSLPQYPTYLTNLEAQRRAEKDAEKHRNWAEKALVGECDNVRKAQNGQRNHTLNVAALKLGHKVAAGYLDEERVVRELELAAIEVGLDPNEITPTIRSGLSRGLEEPQHPAPKTFLPPPIKIRPLVFERPVDIDLQGAVSDYVVKGIFDRGDLVTLFGQPGAGKSFLSIWMAYRISAGETIFDRRVRPRRVHYFTFEAHAGFRKRLMAANQHYPETDGRLTYSLVKSNEFATSDHIKAIVEQLRREKVEVVFVDTLARFLGAEDENTSQGMAKVIDFADAIHKATNAATIFVHHPGKDLAKGARGHSSLLGAVDCEMPVSRDADDRFVSLKKVKDGLDGDQYAFELAIEQLGVDEEGDAITTCVVEQVVRVDVEEAKPVRKPTASQQKGWDILHAHLLEHGTKQQVDPKMAKPEKCIARSGLYLLFREEGWLDIPRTKDGTEDCTLIASNSERSKIRNLLNGLKGRELLNFNRDWVWLID